MRLRRWWCRTFHASIMFGGGRHYECRTCGLRFEHPALHVAQRAPDNRRLVEIAREA